MNQESFNQPEKTFNTGTEYNMEDFVLKGKTLLVVDDEVDLRDIVASELEFMGGKVYQAENISVAKDFLAKHQFDLIVSDIRMPGGTGIDLLDHVKASNSHIPPIILITGFADITPKEAFNKGAEALMNKPFKLDDLIQVAARYTGSMVDRFSVVEESSNHLDLEFSHDLKENDEFRIGRGGLAVNFEISGRKFDIGQVILFNLKFLDRTLSGTAVCRWITVNEHHNGKVSIGLEFLKLDQESLDFFLAQKISSHPFIPSIP